MSTVRVTLPRYNRSWNLSRQQVLDIIPESLIGQALEEESNAPEISLENPEAMQMIADYLEGRVPLHHVPSLVTAARYLNLPWLNYYADPLYDRVDRISTPNGTIYDTENNRELLRDAAKLGHNLMVRYLLLQGVSPVESLGKTGIVWSQALFGAVEGDNIEAVKLLLEDPRVEATTEASEEEENESTKFQQEIIEALNGHAFTVARWLLQQAPDFNYREYLSERVSQSAPDLDIIKFLLSGVPLDTNFIYMLIQEAADRQNETVIQAILDTMPEELS